MLLLIGMNHRTVPLSIREKIRFNEENLKRFLPVLCTYRGIEEVAILCTCNRVEIYAWAKQMNLAISSLKEFMEDNYHGGDKLDPFLYTLIGEEVISHLFRVSAGLDSQVIGESQILGQVKKAYRLSREVNATDGFLKPLFHRAVSIGKKVREKTEISRGKVSVGSVGVELAKKTLASLRDKTILVLGAGKISELVGANLANEGVKAIVVSNRSYEKACHLAQILKGEAVRFDRLEEGLRQADIVISSTAASHYIIKKSMLKQVMDKRDKPLLFIDLALPRDIEPAAAHLEGVTLYNMEDLDLVIKGNMVKRRKEAKKAEEIVKEEAQEFEKKMKKTGWNQSYAGV
ncbi:glutamyl-tRNA reductase [Candidatus Aerophobetes bacterium Ae_b3a]|nr:MAG: glutamyl-tRNA reductase [Candidatus Aerophobetes bacterium Ae_b3a]